MFHMGTGRIQVHVVAVVALVATTRAEVAAQLTSDRAARSFTLTALEGALLCP